MHETTRRRNNLLLSGNAHGLRWSTTGITVVNASLLSRPNGLFIDSNDTLYIADESNHVIWKLRKNAVGPTIVAGNLQSGGSNSTQLNLPYDVYVDRRGNLYVSEYDGHRVKKFINESANGIMIAGTGSAGSNLNQFWSARYMSFDATETYMFVADTFNHRVFRFLANTAAGANGTVVAGGNGYGTTNTQLNQP